MIRSITTDFDSDQIMEIEGGARIEAKHITFEEFSGLNAAGYYRMSKGLQFKAHRHKGWLLITILKGRLEVKTLGHENETFEPGDTYLVEPDHCHTETALEDDTVVLVTQGIKDPDMYQIHTVEV